jgi:hypothetical protein
MAEKRAGLFAKAVKKTEGPKVKNKGSNWTVGSNDGDIANSIKELSLIAGEMKTLDVRKKLHSKVVLNHANKNFIRDFATNGVLPETPMRLSNQDGDQVTYVVQDRSSQYELSEAQLDALAEILGEDSAQDVVYREQVYGFNREVMAVPGVQEAIENALTAAIDQLISDGVLTDELADQLVDGKERLALKPGTVSMAAKIVGNDQTRLAAFFEAIGSCATRYVKT